MTATVSAEARRLRGTYFFISYAHVPPLPDRDDSTEPPDHWVERFYDDLRERVEQAAAPHPIFEGIGFLDSQLPPGSDWKTLLTEALGEAQVFVPLYSPRYFEWSWPKSEQQSFRKRLSGMPPQVALAHIQPVLWIPMLSPSQKRQSAAALPIGEGVPRYAEYGLRSLLRLNHLRPAYEEILARLARRIVEVAERSPLDRSPAPPVEPDFSTSGQGSFVIAVLAPTRDALPAGRTFSAPYDAQARRWRPFRGAALPVAEYAANLVGRMDLPAQIGEGVAQRADLDSHPGLLLIDPWLLADPAGREMVDSAVNDLREWVSPVVVVDEADPQYHPTGADLAAELTDMLARKVTQPVRNVRSADEFGSMVPYLVANSRKQFLRNAKGEGPRSESR